MYERKRERETQSCDMAELEGEDEEAASCLLYQ